MNVMKHGFTITIVAIIIANPKGQLSLKDWINLSISKGKYVLESKLIFDMSTFIKSLQVEMQVLTY